jgi:hypothetical protein
LGDFLLQVEGRTRSVVWWGFGGERRTRSRRVVWWGFGGGRRITTRARSVVWWSGFMSWQVLEEEWQQ